MDPEWHCKLDCSTYATARFCDCGYGDAAIRACSSETLFYIEAQHSLSYLIT